MFWWRLNVVLEKHQDTALNPITLRYLIVKIKINMFREVRRGAFNPRSPRRSSVLFGFTFCTAGRTLYACVPQLP